MMGVMISVMMGMRVRIGIESVDSLGYYNGKSSSDEKAGSKYGHQMETIFR